MSYRAGPPHRRLVHAIGTFTWNSSLLRSRHASECLSDPLQFKGYMASEICPPMTHPLLDGTYQGTAECEMELIFLCSLQRFPSSR